MNVSALFMSDARLTYVDSIVIAALCFIVIRLYRTRHPKNEQERRARRKSLFGLVCFLVYALGRIAVIVLNR